MTTNYSCKCVRDFTICSPRSPILLAAKQVDSLPRPQVSSPCLPLLQNCPHGQPSTHTAVFCGGNQRLRRSLLGTAHELPMCSSTHSNSQLAKGLAGSQARVNSMCNSDLLAVLPAGVDGQACVPLLLTQQYRVQRMLPTVIVSSYAATEQRGCASYAVNNCQSMINNILSVELGELYFVYLTPQRIHNFPLAAGE